MADCIYVDGSRGGAGATTCAVKLAAALAEAGERTLYMDGDPLCGDGLYACGLTGLNVYSLGDAQRGECRIKQALLQHPLSPNFYVLPSLGYTDPKFAADAVTECSELFDYVICDKIALPACKRAIVVTEPYQSFLKGAEAKCSSLKDAGFKDVGLIVNKVNGGLVFDGEIMTPQETAALLRCELYGVVPEDLTLPLGKIRSATKKAFSLTAQYVSGKGKKVYGVIKPYAGVAGMIKRKMRARI